jgi:hypothetical protein
MWSVMHAVALGLHLSQSGGESGVLDETDVVGMVFPDQEVISAGFHRLNEARATATPLLAVVWPPP